MRFFCITLPELPERTAAAKKHFVERGMKGVEFFNGIHAETFGFRTVHHFSEQGSAGDQNYIIGPGHVGCWLSHYMLWQSLTICDWKSGHHERAFIMEDDVKLASDWKVRMGQALHDAPPDFDLLFIGSCCCEDKPKTLVKGEVWDVRWPFCLHAYVVAKKALPVMLSTNRRCNLKIDVSLYINTFPKLKVYTVLPRIADQFNMELHV